MKSILSPLAVAVLGASLAVPASATVVIIPELPELVQRVDVIAQVTVGEQVMVEEAGRIWTRTTLQVSDGLKGAKAGETLVVHQLGGRVGDRQMWISGAYKFKTGSEVVFFGSRWARAGEGAVIPFGVGYGIFEIAPDDSGRIGVREQLGDIAAYKANADGSRSRVQPTARSWDSVAAFKDEIRGLLNAERAGLGFEPPQKFKLTPRVRGGAK